MLNLVEGLFDVCWHGNVTYALVVVPVDGETAIEGAETLGDPYHKQVPLPSIPAYRAREATT